MLGIAAIVAGVLVVKVLGNEMGWLVFLVGCAIGLKGGIALSYSGAKEIGN
jgi:hypothetical protein